MMNNKYAIIVAALSTTLTMSACGKKSEGYKPTAKPTTSNSLKGDTPTNSPAKLEVKATPTPSPTPSTEITALPPTKGPGEFKPPQEAQPIEKKPAVEKKPEKKAPAKKPTTTHKSSSNSSTSLIDKDSRFTGFKSQGSNLAFSGSSEDQYLQALKNKAAAVGGDSRKSNALLAQSIVSAKMINDPFAGGTQIQIVFQGGNQFKTVALSGTLDTDNFSTMGSSDSSVSASGKCIDFALKKQCHNALIKIVSNRGVATVIVRNTSAKLHYTFDLSDNVGTEYYNLREFLLNNVRGEATDNKVKTIRFETFEVVNGKSGFQLILEGINKELIAFSGDLLIPEFGTEMNVPVKSARTKDFSNFNIVHSDANLTNLSSAISAVRMTNNNGQGQIRLLLKVSSSNKEEYETMSIVVSRFGSKTADL